MKDLYVERVKAWEPASLQGFGQTREQELKVKRQRKKDQKEIKQLKHELREREKALTETAASLVLRKKLDTLWENDNEDDKPSRWAKSKLRNCESIGPTTLGPTRELYEEYKSKTA